MLFSIDPIFNVKFYTLVIFNINLLKQQNHYEEQKLDTLKFKLHKISDV